ncbi:PR domain zinc finger protein 15-like [Chelonus insularis]|uniref:PR domain zinc finger protein 15-like n=1 Tax=Chelonus insularis TaxID=460826 RepID=UPI00158A0A1C|nr:PR domain zinc finger protein 15-like [Chelonus insularis]
MMPPLKKLMIIKNDNDEKINNPEEKKTQSVSLVCNICGQSHDTHECPFLSNLQYIKDSPVLSRARQTLPKDLEITKMADGSLSVIAKREFQRGMTFGPFQAKRNWAMNPANLFPIKVFGNSSVPTCYLDYSDEDLSNWMSFILPASNAKEQNLICYQVKQDIFYTVMRIIPPGEEFRVWYAPYYALKMKMPLYNMDFANVESDVLNRDIEIRSLETANDSVEILNRDIAQQLAERLPAQQLGAKCEQENWTCLLCSSTINSVVNYAKHLMEHYKPLLGAFCNICNRKFYNNSILEKHKIMKHSDIAMGNETMGIPTSSNQQQQNTQTVLNMSDMDGQTSDAMKDIFEKFKSGKTITESALIMTDKENQSDISLLDSHAISMNDFLQNSGNLMESSSLNSSLKSILENQCLNINISSMADSILSDNISTADGVRFNVDELASELSLDITADDESANKKINNFDCDICGKKFQRPDYLYRHLRKHTGEFICSGCLGVFARKENLLTHVCSFQKTNVNLECPYCSKTFAVKKYLKRHMARHFEHNRCKWCRNTFTSPLELKSHECNAPKHICNQCNKIFVHRAHLNRHMKLHSEPKPIIQKIKKKSTEDEPAICEKCGDIFKTPYSLKQHLKSHGERTYECEICQRRFHRIGVLKEHKQIHQSAQIPCDVCGKKLKSKKALDVHVLLHGNKKFQCEKCDKSFFQRCNYLKHYKQIHTEKIMHKCPHCPTQFANEISFNKHVTGHTKPSKFTCSSCHKSFHGQYQLKRHIQSTHSGIIYRCPFCKMTARHKHSMRRHFERQHKSLSNEWDQPGFVNQLIEKSALNEEKIDNVDNIDNSKILLSVPEVTETFSNIPEVTQVDNRNETLIDDSEILLQSTEINHGAVEASEISLTEVPQLSISDSDSQLAESVLNNAYIFGENGDIMFYVLDNNSVINY